MDSGKIMAAVGIIGMLLWPSADLRMGEFAVGFLGDAPLCAAAKAGYCQQ